MCKLSLNLRSEVGDASKVVGVREDRRQFGESDDLMVEKGRKNGSNASEEFEAGKLELFRSIAENV